MDFRRWIAIFISTVVAVGAMTAGFNALTDPFGIFGDVAFDWYAYNMTQNPRISKIAYLDENHENYDSYIIGSSKTSSFSTEKLNVYYGGASFYNMMMYGGDMYDIEMTALYILEHYKPENIIVNMGLEETVSYGTQVDDLKGNLHASADGTSLLRFYAKYLFANPSYAVRKITAWLSDEYLVGENDVFDPETGAYDKSARDVERVGNLDDYLKAYPGFRTVLKKTTLDAMDKCLASVERIKTMCENKGVSFLLVISPIYRTEMDRYDKAQLEEFLRRLSEITDFWNFSGYNSVNCEPRYFYDPYHFRNAVGDMALARIFGDASVYVPEDFGRYVTPDTVDEHLAVYFGERAPDGPDGAASGFGRATADAGTYTCEVPILMYHHLTDGATGKSAITPETFEEHMAELKKAGYNAVGLYDLTAYVEKGTELPENPVVITFDDGYASNYELAFPILKKYNMKAVMFIIGVSVGADTYKDTGVPIIPHFTYEQAKEMVSGGIVEIQSHSYDMHNTRELDKDYRHGVLRKKGESEEEYIEAFRDDFMRSAREIMDNTGCAVTAYAYPYGLYTTLSEVLLSRMGVRITMTIEEGVNTVIKGLPQSLRAMKRYNMCEDINGSELIEMLSEARSRPDLN